MDTRIFDNNKFWQKVKPLFSDKTVFKQSIRLTENGKIVSDKSSRNIKQLFYGLR